MTKMKWKFLIFLGLLFCFSCSSLSEKNTLNINYRNYLSENKCEKAADEIPLEKDNAQYLTFQLFAYVVRIYASLFEYKSNRDNVQLA